MNVFIKKHLTGLFTSCVQVVFIFFFTSCGRNLKDNQALGTGMNTGINPEIKIFLQDGTIIPYTTGDQKGETIWINEGDDTSYLAFLAFPQGKPDTLSVELTPVYNGAQKWTLFSVDRPLWRHNDILSLAANSEYIPDRYFHLAYAYGLSPNPLITLHYTLTAWYEGVGYDYHFSMKIKRLNDNSDTPLTQSRIQSGSPRVHIDYICPSGKACVSYSSAKKRRNGIDIEKKSLLQSDKDLRTIVPNLMMMLDDEQLIVVDFTSSPPDSIEIEKHIFLKNKNDEPYWASACQIDVKKAAAGIYEFPVEMFDKMKQGYGKGIAYIGYSVTAKWGENCYEYVFMFSTTTPDDCEM